VAVEQAKASMSSIKQQYEEQLSQVLEEKHKIADKYAKAADEVRQTNPPPATTFFSLLTIIACVTLDLQVKELKQRLSTINASVQAGSGSPLPPVWLSLPSAVCVKRKTALCAHT